MNICIEVMKTWFFSCVLFLAFSIDKANSCAVEEEAIQTVSSSSDQYTDCDEPSHIKEGIIGNNQKLAIWDAGQLKVHDQKNYAQTPGQALEKGWYLVTLQYNTQSSEMWWRILGGRDREQACCYHRANNLRTGEQQASTYIKISSKTPVNIECFVGKMTDLKEIQRITIEPVDRKTVPKRFKGRWIVPYDEKLNKEIIMGKELQKEFRNGQIKFGNTKGTIYNKDKNDYQKKQKKK